MKLLKRLLFIILPLFPIFIKADEIKYKWYYPVETDIHYEYEIDNKTCNDNEVLDKNTFIYGDYFYSLEKPKEKENRIIEKVTFDMSLNRNYFKYFKITSMEPTIDINIKELYFTNNNGDKLSFTSENSNFLVGSIKDVTDDNLNTYATYNRFFSIYLKFDEIIDVTDFIINIVYEKGTKDFKGFIYQVYLTDTQMNNAYADYSTNVDTSCEGTTCYTSISIIETMQYNAPVDISTIGYKYKDAKYKCSSIKKIYIPGYYDNIEGFTKDENDYIIEKTTVETVAYSNATDLVKQDENITINPIDNVVEDIIETDSNDLIAYNTNSEVKKESNNIFLFIVVFGLISIMSLITIFVYKVKKSRMK